MTISKKRAIREARSRAGKLGGPARGRAAKAGRMDEEEARAIWLDPKINADDALKQMIGWSRRTAYRHLGKRL